MQLCDDLKLRYQDSVTDIRTLKDAHDWNNSVNGTLEDEITWKDMHVQFDDKVCGLKLTKGMHEECGVDCEDESKRGFVEKLFNFLKRQITKISNIQRENPMENC